MRIKGVVYLRLTGLVSGWVLRMVKESKFEVTMCCGGLITLYLRLLLWLVC